MLEYIVWINNFQIINISLYINVLVNLCFCKTIDYATSFFTSSSIFLHDNHVVCGLANRIPLCQLCKRKNLTSDKSKGRRVALSRRGKYYERTIVLRWWSRMRVSDERGNCDSRRKIIDRIKITE